MALKLGELVIQLTAKTDAFARGMTDMRDLTFTSVRGITDSLEKVGSTLGRLKFDNAAQLKRSFDIAANAAAGLTLGIGSGAVGALALVAEKSIESGAKLYEMSQKTGVGVEALSSFGYAAKQSGLDADAMALAMERLSKNALTVAQTGTGPAAKAFAQLGISVTDTSGKLRPVGDLIVDVAGKFAAMENGTVKTGLAMQLFGKAGAEVIPLLNRGRDGLSEMTDEAQRLGLVMSSDTAARSHELEEAMGRVRGQIEGAGLQITAGMIPALQQLANAFTGSASSADTWRQVGEGVGDALKWIALRANDGAEGMARLAKAQADVQRYNPLSFAVPGARAYLQERSDYFGSLIAQAQESSNRLLGAMNVPPLPHAPSGAAPDVAAAATKVDSAYAKLAATMKQLTSVANELQLKGQDPLTKAMLDYEQALDHINELQNNLPAGLQKTAEYEIAVRQAEQDRGLALKALNRELDKLANDSGAKALEILSKQTKLPGFSLGPIGGPAIPTLNIDPVAARVEELMKNIHADQSMIAQWQNASLTAVQRQQITEAEIQSLLERHLLTQEQYNRLKADAVERGKQERIQDLLRPGQGMGSGITAAVMDLQLQTSNAARNMYDAMTGAFQGIEQSFQQTFAGIIDGTETVGQAFRNLGAGILSSIGNALAQMLARWVTTHVIMALFSKLVGTSEAEAVSASIASNNTANFAKAASAAALAADNTLAWWSAVFPPAAPAAAMAQYAVGMGIAGLATFHGGGIADDETISLLKRDEMVLPPNLSDMFQGMAQRGYREMDRPATAPTFELSEHFKAQRLSTEALRSETRDVRRSVDNLTQVIRLLGRN